MECYVGLDVHSKASVFVIQDGHGQVMAQGEMPTTPEGLRRWYDAQHLPAGTPVAHQDVDQDRDDGDHLGADADGHGDEQRADGPGGALLERPLALAARPGPPARRGAGPRLASEMASSAGSAGWPDPG